MNQSNSNAGGWNGSYMRKTVLGNSGSPANPPANSLMAALPADLRNNMKSTTKYTDNTGNGQNNASSVTATTDYLSFWRNLRYSVPGAMQIAQNRITKTV